MGLYFQKNERIKMSNAKPGKEEPAQSCEHLEERGYCTSQKTCEYMEDFGEGYACTKAEREE